MSVLTHASSLAVQLMNLVSITSIENQALEVFSFKSTYHDVLFVQLKQGTVIFKIEKKSPIWQSFKILVMPDRCLLLLTSKVALSRSKSMNFVYQKHSTAV